MNALRHMRGASAGLGSDLNRVWHAPTTTDRDRKELLRSLLEEVNIAVDRTKAQAKLILRWRGGMFSEIDVALWQAKDSVVRTDEDTVELLRRLAAHHHDAVIAGILNRQGRKTARGLRFTAQRVASLRRHRKIPCFKPPQVPPEGEPVSVKRAAGILGLNPSTLHRWINDGFIAGEQITSGAPWRIRMTEELKAKFVDKAPEGYVPMIKATKVLGVSRQTVLQRVKRGELLAVHVHCGRSKGIRIKVTADQPELFPETKKEGV